VTQNLFWLTGLSYLTVHKTPMAVGGWTEEDLRNALDAHFRCQEPGCDKHCLVLDGEKEYLPRA
jgi:hypothetical protein